MFKIITVIGARPQFIKAAAVSREISKHNELKEVIIHTGQHFDDNMSEIFFQEMQIPKPAYNLGVHNLSHGAMTGRMLEEIEKIALQEKPDLVLVYGDTNSTLAGSLAARKLHIKTAHVEAGLRSFNMLMPEEVNRILTDRISDYLFCPTATAIENLKREGFNNYNCDVVLTGDVMYDAALFYSEFSSSKSNIVKQLGLAEFALCTIHRAENTDDINNLRNIFSALNEANKSLRIVLPLHPRTKKIVMENNIPLDITVIEPVGYFDMLELLKNCKIAITDSGGLQKEAYFFKKNCITLRKETEWTELVDNGFNILAGADAQKIQSSISQMISKKNNYGISLYGQGDASKKIIAHILNDIKK